MKNKSFKWKISLWFTLLLIAITLLFALGIASIYKIMTDGKTENVLVTEVEDMTTAVSEDEVFAQMFTEDSSDVDSSFFYQNDILICAYHYDGTRSIGIFLSDELDNIPLVEDEIKDRRLDGQECFIYDQKITLEDGSSFWIRGYAYSDADIVDILYFMRYQLILFPFLLLIALGGGYMLAGKFLNPVKAIGDTADEIRKSGDLSRRIEITERGDELHALAGTFNDMFAQLENKFEAEKEFSSNASHELRTPVAVILAECEYAILHAKREEEFLETISKIQFQGFRMQKLVEDLLVYTRIRQNSNVYPISQMPLAPVIRSVLEEYSMLEDKNISIQEELDESASAAVNPELLGILLRNLIGNAVKYGKENGKVKITLEMQDKTPVLTVADDGIGIAAKDLPHIWERFYRSEKVRDMEGTGIGLSLVKEIAHYHGGEVYADSTEGEGSKFTLCFK